jgi:hypothetical protein
LEWNLFMPSSIKPSLNMPILVFLMAFVVSKRSLSYPSAYSYTCVLKEV